MPIKNYQLMDIRGCNDIAFYLSEMPKIGELIKPTTVTLVDGTTPKHGSRIICGSCGRTPVISIHFIKKVPEF